MRKPMGQVTDLDTIGIPATEAAAETAANGVYENLRQDILAGRLAANERLKVSSLAERYKTSTNPVREALQQLRGEGFVVIEPNRGARVRAIDEDFVRDIFEIEVLLEPYLTRWFVNHCAPEDIERLDVVAAEIEALNFADPLRHSILDTQFHQLMYDRHYNRHAVDLWWKHREILRVIAVGHGTSLRRRRDVIAEHRALLSAIRDHEEDRAAEIIMEHVRGSGMHISGLMRAQRTRTPA
jgi:DNA-binding GntR family transcriptional regulator